MVCANLSFVMAGLGPAIRVLLADRKTWMPGTGPGMTVERSRANITYSVYGEICR
jgi:hypothetical protein